MQAGVSVLSSNSVRRFPILLSRVYNQVRNFDRVAVGRAALLRFLKTRTRMGFHGAEGVGSDCPQILSRARG